MKRLLAFLALHRPTDGGGMPSWDYICGVRSARGRECALRQHHGLMHRDDFGYQWRSNG